MRHMPDSPPSLWDKRICRIVKMHDAVLISCPLKSEVEPLRKIGGIVAAQCKTDIGGGGQVFDDDGAGIETGADFNHGEVLAVAGCSNRISRDFTVRTVKLQPAGRNGVI